MTEYWYRLVDRLEGDEYTTFVTVRACKLAVIKHTPQGVKLIGINHGRGNPRLVLHSSRKKWACPTLEEAVASFIARKKRQARIYAARAANADYAHDLAVTGDFEVGRDWYDDTPA